MNVGCTEYCLFPLPYLLSVFFSRFFSFLFVLVRRWIWSWSAFPVSRPAACRGSIRDIINSSRQGVTLWEGAKCFQMFARTLEEPD